MVSIADITRYCRDIAAACSPQRIILFGSYAYGEPNEDSDVDVLVVLPKTRRVMRDAEVKIRLEARANFPVDMLVRGEAEVERRVRDGDSFMLDVTKNGRVMYETVNA